MQFLNPNEHGSIAFDSYFKYIESIREQLSPTAYSFASNFDHYSLNSHCSLHDAWLERTVIEEIASGQREETRSLGIKLAFLGPYHDRTLMLNYDRVSSYTMCMSGKASNTTAHGDVVVHEVRVKDALIEHEILFASGATILIACKDLMFLDQPRGNQRGRIEVDQP
jgi:hypothetical protein